MSYFDEDSRSMLDVYLLETGQLMGKLDEILLDAEKAGHIGMEDINSIFRIMHTMKSSSAMMGLTGLSAVAHRLEDVFSALRDSGGSSVKVRGELFEVLFRVSDFIGAEMRKMRDTDYQPSDMSGIAGEIEAVLSENGEEALAEQPEVEPAPCRKEKDTPDTQETEFVDVRVERLDDLEYFTEEMLALASAFSEELERRRQTELEEKFGRPMKSLAQELGRTVLNMRMVPVAFMVPKLRRVLRDICRDQQKEIEFVVTGQDTEADKNVVNQMREAAMHIVRNCADHGIESPEERRKCGKPPKGTVRLCAESADEELVVSISDDGKGMELEKVKEKARQAHLFTRPEEEYTEEEILEFCTLPGFTTSSKASQYSGRGVGMDIVKMLTVKAGGHMKMESRKGEGTTVTLYMPLTHAIVDNTLFRAGGHLFSVPFRETVRFFPYDDKSSDLRIEDGRDIFTYDDRALPVIDVARAFRLGQTDGERTLIYVKGTEEEACFLVGEVLGRERLLQKLLPKMLGAKFKARTGMTGCCVMGDGSICMILDVDDFVRTALQKDTVKEGEAYVQ